MKENATLRLFLFYHCGAELAKRLILLKIIKQKHLKLFRE